MSEHPIEGLMLTAMSSIQDMVDVNTIIGEPIETSNNVVIIPISKVSFGFAAGGSEFKGETIDEYTKKEKEEAIQYRLPFGGGSGAGVTINPVAFIIVQEGCVKLLPVCHSSAMDKLIDYVPDLIEKVNQMLNKQLQQKNEQLERTNKIIEENSKKAKAEPKAEPKPATPKAEKVQKVEKQRASVQKRPKEEEIYEYEYIDTNEPANDVINMEEGEYDD